MLLPTVGQFCLVLPLSSTCYQLAVIGGNRLVLFGTSTYRLHIDGAAAVNPYHFAVLYDA